VDLTLEFRSRNAPIWTAYQSRCKLLILGIVWLLIGFLFYAVARPQIATLFLPEINGKVAITPVQLTYLLGPFPTFVHVIAFIFLSISVVGINRVRVYAVCSVWASVEVLFELMQHPFVRGWITREAPPLQNVVCGTFDVKDILAGVIGSLLAGQMILQTGGSMKEGRKRMMKAAAIAGVFALGIVTIIASNGGGGGGGGGGQKSPGSITVNTGFGAVTSTPYQCTGQTTVTVTPQNLTGTQGSSSATSKPVSYSGFSSTTPNEPACQQNVIFTGLKAGTWQISDGRGTCTATVADGQSANVKIWNGACQ
jgi:hypothetical protein